MYKCSKKHTTIMTLIEFSYCVVELAFPGGYWDIELESQLQLMLKSISKIKCAPAAVGENRNVLIFIMNRSDCALSMRTRN